MRKVIGGSAVADQVGQGLPAARWAAAEGLEVKDTRRATERWVRSGRQLSALVWLAAALAVTELRSVISCVVFQKHSRHMERPWRSCAVLPCFSNGTTTAYEHCGILTSQNQNGTNCWITRAARPAAYESYPLTQPSRALVGRRSPYKLPRVKLPWHTLTEPKQAMQATQRPAAAGGSGAAAASAPAPCPATRRSTNSPPLSPTDTLSSSSR